MTILSAGPPVGVRGMRPAQSPVLLPSWFLPVMVRTKDLLNPEWESRDAAPYIRDVVPLALQVGIF